MNQRRKGIILAVITAVMWGIMGMFVRDVSLSVFQYRNLIFPLCARRSGIFCVFACDKAKSIEN